MKKTELNGYVYDFSVNYDAVAVDDILDIHRYLMKQNNITQNVWVYSKMFFTVMTFFSCNVLSVNSLKCISMDNQKRKVRPEIININSNESLFYPCSVKIGNCSGSCNNINDPYARFCVPDVVKNMKMSKYLIQC